ncbi:MULTISPECIES: TlpA family protein disulfide reductase [Dyella]|uniref:TlpA family protein disulfide reductase n=2 Tax=Dyella TaxID=231454 RepID=A0A4V2NLB8_9GAMM|nr:MULTISPECIES: TlpA disulfide reductase family protein [Dyella]TBR36765.1 TlpA family protein disulfide reductase [Dyella terrae]TCI08144.1 TlpA family protein disulfide reductase [Dyella soli]
MKSHWAIVALAVVVAAGGAWLQHESRKAHLPDGVQVANVGDVRPDLALRGVDGTEHRLSAFHGQRVLLNFWASWCGPCLDEMPALARAQAKFGDQAVNVVGIAMDDPANVQAFLAAHPVPYPILLGELASPSTSLRLGNVGEVLPYSVLLDANGRILATRRGVLDEATLNKWLAASSAP